MAKSFKVVIWFNDKYGFIEYEPEQKTVTVVLDDTAKKSEVENYLGRDHEIQLEGKTLLDFSPQLISPQASLYNFKTSLTRLWEATGVLVCWSNPV
ncbi:MAG: hypothetical protein LBR56_09680 [Sporomusaceae bacterium]|nr:hypothetical protein [Sporomusaceae bacterium]